MKKKITIGLILIILITSFYKTKEVLGTDVFEFGKDESLTEIQGGTEAENFNKLQESGTVSTNGETRQENVPTQVSGNSINIFNRLVGRLFTAIPMVMNDILSKITSDSGEIFTIERTITNHYDLFNLKYLITPAEGGKKEGTSGILEPISKNASTWFIGVRNLSLAGSIITLMYVGIRLATATVSTKRAQFKRMLFSWFEGIGIMLTLQFFIVTIILASNWMVDTLNSTIENDSSITTIEEQIMKNVDENLDSINQIHTLFFYIVLFTMFSYYELKFFALYIGRLIRVAFYIIISPLVCLTYPVDKVGDGRPQAFNNWALEITITVFIQPMHLLIYMIMISSMGEIIVRNPVLGIIFLALLSHVERIVKHVLKLRPRLGPGLKDIKLLSSN
ncbi:MAG: hypothetical protein IKG14_00845 [Clostridia bacterium]|nr:hypothetical protein [Clostridia bacterium]MBR3324583.1 hypothetical protein [Clostridia bacterium]